MGARHVAKGSPRLAKGAQAARRSTLARRAALALATAALGGLALAAPALADTTIGQTGGDPGLGCGGPLVRADTTYAVPSGGGTITSFSYGSAKGNRGQQLDFLVLRAAGGSDYTVVGKSGLVTLAGTGVKAFAANIAVQGGDILGFWQPGNLEACIRTVGTGGGELNSAVPSDPPDPSVNDVVSLPNGPFTEIDLNESATLVPTLTPRCAGQPATIFAVPGQPTTGTDGPDVIFGTDGIDRIKALGGRDLVCGRGHADEIAGGGSRDQLHGGNGADSLAGGKGDDFLFGDKGDDSLDGNAGFNTLDGGGGTNTCVNGPVFINCQGP